MAEKNTGTFNGGGSDSEDDELAALREAALRSKRKRVPEIRVPEIRVPEVRVPEVRVPEVRVPASRPVEPIVPLLIPPFLPTIPPPSLPLVMPCPTAMQFSRQPFRGRDKMRMPRMAVQNVPRTPRSNLIVIQTVPLDEEVNVKASQKKPEVSVTQDTFQFVRPQDKWARSDEVKQPASPAKHKVPSKFRRYDSDSESDEDISPVEDSESDEEEEDFSSARRTSAVVDEDRKESLGAESPAFADEVDGPEVSLREIGSPLPDPLTSLNGSNFDSGHQSGDETVSLELRQSSTELPSLSSALPEHESLKEKTPPPVEEENDQVRSRSVSTSPVNSHSPVSSRSLSRSSSKSSSPARSLSGSRSRKGSVSVIASPVGSQSSVRPETTASPERLESPLALSQKVQAFAASKSPPLGSSRAPAVVEGRSRTAMHQDSRSKSYSASPASFSSQPHRESRTKSRSPVGCATYKHTGSGSPTGRGTYRHTRSRSPVDHGTYKHTGSRSPLGSGTYKHMRSRSGSWSSADSRSPVRSSPRARLSSPTRRKTQSRSPAYMESRLQARTRSSSPENATRRSDSFSSLESSDHYRSVTQFRPETQRPSPQKHSKSPEFSRSYERRGSPVHRRSPVLSRSPGRLRREGVSRSPVRGRSPALQRSSTQRSSPGQYRSGPRSPRRVNSPVKSTENSKPSMVSYFTRHRDGRSRSPAPRPTDLSYLTAAYPRSDLPRSGFARSRSPPTRFSRSRSPPRLRQVRSRSPLPRFTRSRTPPPKFLQSRSPAFSHSSSPGYKGRVESRMPRQHEDSKMSDFKSFVNASYAADEGSRSRDYGSKPGSDRFGNDYPRYRHSSRSPVSNRRDAAEAKTLDRRGFADSYKPRNAEFNRQIEKKADHSENDSEYRKTLEARKNKFGSTGDVRTGVKSGRQLPPDNVNSHHVSLERSDQEKNVGCREERGREARKSNQRTDVSETRKTSRATVRTGQGDSKVSRERAQKATDVSEKAVVDSDTGNSRFRAPVLENSDSDSETVGQRQKHFTERNDLPARNPALVMTRNDRYRGQGFQRGGKMSTDNFRSREDRRERQNYIPPLIEGLRFSKRKSRSRSSADSPKRTKLDSSPKRATLDSPKRVKREHSKTPPVKSVLSVVRMPKRSISPEDDPSVEAKKAKTSHTLSERAPVGKSQKSPDRDIAAPDGVRSLSEGQKKPRTAVTKSSEKCSPVEAPSGDHRTVQITFNQEVSFGDVKPSRPSVHERLGNLDVTKKKERKTDSSARRVVTEERKFADLRDLIGEKSRQVDYGLSTMCEEEVEADGGAGNNESYQRIEKSRLGQRNRKFDNRGSRGHVEGRQSGRSNYR